MKYRSKESIEHRQRTIEAVATFVAWVHAEERGQAAKASNAKRSLDRLGISVQYSPAHCTKGGAK